MISAHVSPASSDLNRPLPGPPLDIVYSRRNASHSAAKTTFGLRGSIATSTAPLLSSLKSVLLQVLAPSVVLYTPRAWLGALILPNAATNTTSGLVGWMRILEMTGASRKPTCVHVRPASLDLYTPSPDMALPRMHDSPMPM